MYISILATMTLGVLLGVLAGLLGTGGGTFAIPALVYSMGYGQKLAQGTALVMVVTNVFKGLLKYNDRSGLGQSSGDMMHNYFLTGDLNNAPEIMPQTGMTNYVTEREYLWI